MPRTEETSLERAAVVPDAWRAFESLPHAPLARATRPFQFGSIEDLDALVARALQYGLAVEGLSPQTIRWWRTSYMRLRAFLVGEDRAVRFLRGEPDSQATVLEEWIAELRGRGARHGTVRAYWCAVVSLFDRFTRMHGVWNPLRQFRRPRASRPIPRALYRADAERLLAYLCHARGHRFLVARNVAMVACMLLAGLRRGEVLRLELRDVRLGAQTLRIRDGKGVDGGKSRTAYIPRQLRTLLRAYEDEREDAGLGAAEPYFVGVRTGQRLNEGAIRRLFATVQRRTGLRVSSHMLRHTYVTLLRQSGVEDRLAMDLAGHSSLVMTQRYSAVFSGEHLAAVDNLHLDF